jgi:hypothetical protein
MDKELFKSGEVAPVSGNYRFIRHEKEESECIPRPRVYVHLRKGMKIPLHDQCLRSALYELMTVTHEESDPKIIVNLR